MPSMAAVAGIVISTSPSPTSPLHHDPRAHAAAMPAGTPRYPLKPALLDRLRLRLTGPPVDGGLWTSRKGAAWMADELGLASVAVQRGWEALRAVGWSVQVPRPEHPARATPEEREALRKSSPPLPPRRRRSIRARPSRSSPRTSTASG